MCCQQSSENENRTSVSVVGLGYIGLPTAVLLAASGLNVRGFDTDETKIEALNASNPLFNEPGLSRLLESAVSKGNLSASKDLLPSDCFIVTVPTPLTGSNTADMSFVDAAIDNICKVITAGSLVIIESTCPPGTTSRIAERIQTVRPELDFLDDSSENSIFLAYCPERVLPGDTINELINNDRIIGGHTPGSAHLAGEVYSTFCKGELSRTSAATAEVVKLAENAFRDINIAYANELSIVCDRIEISTSEVINLANRHPRVNILKPGPGVGGHCLPIDPWFLHQTAPDATALIKSARQVNDAKTSYIADRITAALRAHKEPTLGILGITYKPNVSDTRESPALHIVDLIATEFGQNEILVCEPHLSTLPSQLSGRENVKLSTLEDVVSRATVIALLVNHREFESLDLMTFKESRFINAESKY